MPGSVAGPEISRQYEVPLPERMTALLVADGTRPVVAWTMTDPATGGALDLTPYQDDAGDVRCAMKLAEATLRGGRFLVTGVTGTAAGVVSGQLDTGALGGPGIFLMQVAALDAQGVPSVLNSFYLVVERSLWGSATTLGPLGFAELRLHLRDSSPAENRLLDVRQFDDAEIARCLLAVVEQWNGALPPGYAYTTQDFPYRDLWRQGAVANLQKLAAEWYRKNRLDNTAGGISVADLAKADEYDRQADQALAAFRVDVQSRKVSLNMEAAYGGVGSPYRYAGRHGW